MIPWYRRLGDWLADWTFRHKLRRGTVLILPTDWDGMQVTYRDYSTHRWGQAIEVRRHGSEVGDFLTIHAMAWRWADWSESAGWWRAMAFSRKHQAALFILAFGGQKVYPQPWFARRDTSNTMKF